jgi:hypothetical protein
LQANLLKSMVVVDTHSALERTEQSGLGGHIWMDKLAVARLLVHIVSQGKYPGLVVSHRFQQEDITVLHCSKTEPFGDGGEILKDKWTVSFCKEIPLSR